MCLYHLTILRRNLLYRARITFLGYCILTFALTSCSVSDSSQIIIHPILGRIPEIEKSHDFVSNHYNSVDLQNAKQLAKNLLSPTKILTLGVLE